MTIGVGGLDSSDGNLAYLMGAQEDRLLAAATSGVLPEASPALEVNRQLDPSDGVNYAGGSSYSEGMPLLPSSVGLTGVMGVGRQGQNEARDALCSGLAGFAGLFETIGRTDTYLTLMKGTSWPTPLNEGKIGGGYVTPTVMSLMSNINQGWNAAAQPGPPPGLNVGYSDKTLGPSSWAEAMDYSPSPLADKMGELQGIGTVSTASNPGLRKVLYAASHPGTQETGAVARELLKQSVKVAELTAKRAQVMENARKRYTSLVRQVGNIDSQTQLIANKLFDADGEPNPDVSVADIRAFKNLRKKGFKLGREAIRYQKTNVLATALTKNGWAQAKLLQNMSMTMMTGRPKATAVMAAQFEMLGDVSKGLKARRELQVARWSLKNTKERASALQGLDDPRDAHIKKTLSADYWEQELAGAEFFEMEYLGALEGFWGAIKSIGKAIVKHTKKQVRKAIKTTKRVGRTIKRAAKATAEVTAAVSQLKFKKAGRRAYRHAKEETSRLYKAVKRQARKEYKRTVDAANKVKEFGKKAYGSAAAISKPAWRAIKASARVAVAPIKASYNVGRNVARGDFRGAVNSIARSVKDTAKDIGKVYGEMTFGMTCAIDRSPIGKAVAQGVGQAIGTYWGGKAGGAVGHEVGRKANEASRTICEGMDKVGITRGKFRPNKIVPAFKATAVKHAKQTFAPKELLKSGINIGMNYAAGSSGGGAAAFKQLATQVAKKGITTVVKERAKEYGKQYIREQIEAEIQAKIDADPELRKLAKYTPAIRAAYEASGAFRNGEIDMDKIKDVLKKQGVVALKKYGPGAAEAVVGEIAGRRAGEVVGVGARVAAMTPKQREAFLKQEAIRRGRQLATRAATEIGGRRAGRIVGRVGEATDVAARVAAMTPAQREAFLRRQAETQARKLAARGIRAVGGARAVAAARQAERLARMNPAQREAFLRRQAEIQARRLATRGVRAVGGPRAVAAAWQAERLARMTPGQRRAFLQRQARTQGRRLATRAVRRVSPQAVAAARRAQSLARMAPARRQAALRQATVRGAQRLAPQILRASPQMQRGVLLRRSPHLVMQNRAVARAQAMARQRMGVPGALLRA